MERVTVDVADWIVGDGEFGPVSVGDVIVVGLALTAVEHASAADDVSGLDDGRRVLDGELVTALTDDGRRLPPVVRTPDVVVCLVEPLDDTDDGPVRLVGRLAVEPYHWAMPGLLWERFPDGVRPWRVLGVTDRSGRARDGIASVEDGGASSSYLVELAPITPSA